MQNAVTQRAVLTAALQEGRRGLIGLDGIDVPQEWEWVPELGMWTLLVRLTIRPPAESAFPARSDWVIMASPRYPWGGLHIHPASSGGIEETFHHQLLNVATESKAWRQGRICVETGVRALGRQGVDKEPHHAEARLRWNVQRALRWAELAAADMLAREGDPFELPDFDTTNKPLVAFAENESSLQTWIGEVSQSGYVNLVDLAGDASIRVVRSYADMSGRETYAPRWGIHLNQRDLQEEVGLWIRLGAVPHGRSWKAPMTWGELRECAREQGVDLDDVLRRLVPAIRDGEPHVVLIGFPIPSRVGGPQASIYWQPTLMTPTNVSPDGFRRSEENLWSFDRRRSLADTAPVYWLDAENWHQDTISARGLLPSSIRDADVVVVGAGALGSALCESLVRGGVKRLAIMDNEALIAGNLVRHSLTLEDVGEEKVAGLALRLNAASPHASVTGFAIGFPPRDARAIERLRTAELVIDTTGEDNVLAAMETYEWNSPKMFWSLSLGLEAGAVFSYLAVGQSFSTSDFAVQLVPHLEQQRQRYEGVEWPREGVGCWHPVFPARSDQVQLMVAAALSHLIERADRQLDHSELRVFERRGGEVIRRVIGD